MAKILAVDDQQVIRDMVKFTLEGGGHDITLADNPAPALELAKTQKFDLIITDLNMPGGSGINLIAKLRELKATQHTPILVMTTETAETRKNKAKAKGATGWIAKPFDSTRLLTAVDKLSSHLA